MATNYLEDDTIVQKLLTVRHLFENNDETCLELYRALCYNAIGTSFAKHFYPIHIAADIASFLHGEKPSLFFLNSGHEGEVSERMKSIMNQLHLELYHV